MFKSIEIIGDDFFRINCEKINEYSTNWSNLAKHVIMTYSFALYMEFQLFQAKIVKEKFSLHGKFYLSPFPNDKFLTLPN